MFITMNTLRVVDKVLLRCAVVLTIVSNSHLITNQGGVFCNINDTVLCYLLTSPHHARRHNGQGRLSSTFLSPCAAFSLTPS